MHSYAADYYGRGTIDRGLTDEKSMNETALLAFGILLEEAAEQILGSTGDLALVEGQPPASPSPRIKALNGERSFQAEDSSIASTIPPGLRNPMNSNEERSEKRRKVHP